MDGVENETAAGSKDVEPSSDVLFDFGWLGLVKDGSGITSAAPESNVFTEMGFEAFGFHFVAGSLDGVDDLETGFD